MAVSDFQISVLFVFFYRFLWTLPGTSINRSLQYEGTSVKNALTPDGYGSVGDPCYTSATEPVAKVPCGTRIIPVRER